MNWERGFRRVAWVATALATLFVGLITYGSNHVIALEPRLLASNRPDDSSRWFQQIDVSGLGILYFRDYIPDTDLKAHLKAATEKATAMPLPTPSPRVYLDDQGNATTTVTAKRQSIPEFARTIRAKYPEYTDVDDLVLTRQVLKKYPVYRDTVDFREYQVQAIYGRRPLWWIAGVTLAAACGIALVLQGSILLFSWVLRGFTASR